jgi:PAS domain S-box-containing protein
MKPVEVMIVEDEAIVGIDIQENLVNFGYKVVGISSSGEAAIEDAIKNRPEIILMDIQLNGKMNGIETAKQIKEKLGIPVIYLTAYGDDKTLSKALEASPSGYLLKPFVPRELHTSIQTALHKNSTDKETKLARLSYIQKNILKKNTLKNRLKKKEAQTYNYPQTPREEKLHRLKYIREMIGAKKKIEAELRGVIKQQQNIERLLGDLLFSQDITESTAHIFPLEEFATILEYTKEEVFRMGNLIIPILIHSEDFELIEDYFKKITLQPGQIAEFEFRLKHKSGIYRWFSLKGIFQKIDDRNGKIFHSAKDITWLKNLQYTSHISREKFGAISNNPYFGIAILNTNAKILNINPTIENLTGYTKEDLNWLHFSDYIGLKELRGICQNFEKLKNGLIESFQTEVFLHTKGKGALWGYMVFNAIYNPEKMIDRVVCTLVDISESKLFTRQRNS